MGVIHSSPRWKVLSTCLQDLRAGKKSSHPWVFHASCEIKLSAFWVSVRRGKCVTGRETEGA